MWERVRSVLLAVIATGLALGTTACGGESSTAAVAQPVEPAASAISSRNERRLDAVLERLQHAVGGPGSTAAVVKDGRLLWKGAAGFARLEPRRAMTTQDKFAIASVTKTYTATLAMLLVERGELDLDEPVAAALPDLPNADEITTRMLLRHRSGLGDYFGGGYFRRVLREDPTHEWTRD
jgi:D-alanyl-D-alanine carboxypeptidase